MNRWIDISLPVSPNMVVWPGVPQPEFAFRCSMKKGDLCNDSNFFMNCHSGTHIDAPFHYFEEGSPVDQVPLEKLIGEVHLLHMPNVISIDERVLEQFWPKGEKVERVLFKTDNSTRWAEAGGGFFKDYCALTQGGAHWLLNKKLHLIGIDYLSIQKFNESPIVHQLLLKSGVVLLEGITLHHVTTGKYTIFCLPLKLLGREGAPARVILRKE